MDCSIHSSIKKAAADKCACHGRDLWGITPYCFDSKLYLNAYDQSGVPALEPLEVNSIAHRQIGTHLKIPAAYYDKMLEKYPAPPHKKEGAMMIYHQPGEEFWHEGVCYKVGGRIVANEASDYAGLFGNILEIRTEDDRETDNDTPDIYCAFEAPVLSADRLALEQTFSQLYREQKHIEDLGLDMVIMGPEMIVPLEHPAQVYPTGTLYVVAVQIALIAVVRLFFDELAAFFPAWNASSQKFFPKIIVKLM